MNPFPYKDVFLAVEKRLIEAGSTQMDKAKIQSRLDEFKRFENRKLTDDQYFLILVFVAFYSGFNAAKVTSKRSIIQRHFPGWAVTSAYAEKDIRKIINDPDMISHEGKIRACVANAKTFSSLISKHGSIKNYIDSYSPTESFENLLLFKEALETSFKYLGGITVYHFMTDIGLPVLKPDRVMCRIFARLGLLENQRQLLKAVSQGRKFSAATGLPIRYIDIVFVAYGQVKSEEIGINEGICLTKPRCSECRIQDYCGFIDNPARNSDTLHATSQHLG
jgi:DNA-3-methyladenine glycosylase I